jgi:hypothetical protein
MDDETAADEVPPTPEDDRELRDKLNEYAQAKRRARRWGMPYQRSATDCCAEAACDGACAMLGVFALFHLVRVAVGDVRHGDRSPGQSRSGRLALAAIRAY